MRMTINYKTKEDEITLNASGFLFIPYIKFTNEPHDFRKTIIKCGKSLDKLRITEYYTPKHLKNEKIENTMDKTIDKMREMNINERWKHNKKRI